MTADAGSARSNRDVLLRLYEIVNTNVLQSLDEVLDKDVVIEWPQSSERVRGVENMRAVLGNFPGGPIAPNPETMLVSGDEGRYVLTPMFTMVKVEGTGDRLVASLKTRYPDGSDWYLVNIVTFGGGKIVRQVQYFAPVYEAPEWRAQWVERMEGP